MERGQGQTLMRKEWHTFPYYIQEQRVANRWGCPALSSLFPRALTSIRIAWPVYTTPPKLPAPRKGYQPAITCPLIGMQHSNSLVFREAALRIVGFAFLYSGVNLIIIQQPGVPSKTNTILLLFHYLFGGESVP